MEYGLALSNKIWCQCSQMLMHAGQMLLDKIAQLLGEILQDLVCAPLSACMLSASNSKASCYSSSNAGVVHPYLRLTSTLVDEDM